MHGQFYRGLGTNVFKPLEFVLAAKALIPEFLDFRACQTYLEHRVSAVVQGIRKAKTYV